MSVPLLRKAKSSVTPKPAGRSAGKPAASAPPPLVVRQVDVDEDHDGQRLDNFLMRLCKGVPKSHIYKAIRGGEVRVNKGRVQVDHRLCQGDVVRIPPLRLPEKTVKFVPTGDFPVVYEDDAMLVIDKPAGIAVHGGSGVDFGVIEQLRKTRPQAKFLELVHRLDRDTSGLLMVAKKRSALVGLHQSLRDGGWSKHYLVLVVGDWVNDRQHVRLALTKWTTKSGERRVRVDPDGQVAHTIFTLKQRFGSYSLLDAELKTGRTHQIRVHTCASGFPIVGDDKYGDDATNANTARQGFKRMFLHAHTLTLAHPLTGERLSFEAPLPEACQQFIEELSAP